MEEIWENELRLVVQDFFHQLYELERIENLTEWGNPFNIQPLNPLIFVHIDTCKINRILFSSGGKTYLFQSISFFNFTVFLLIVSLELFRVFGKEVLSSLRRIL